MCNALCETGKRTDLVCSYVQYRGATPATILRPSQRAGRASSWRDSPGLRLPEHHDAALACCVRKEVPERDRIDHDLAECVGLAVERALGRKIHRAPSFTLTDKGLDARESGALLF